MPVYPMSALVGLDDLVTALVLAAIDPALGGVLVRGDKGSAKTTAARALASLLPEGAPFVEVPLGASEDRVVGSVDVAAILAEGEHRFAPGLLAAAHGGVLYVDEVNLLADHLVDVLLDAAATGVNRVEREGVSHTHPSRFVLVGSMNPEEGELRPQLLDRFGLSVRVRTPVDPDARAEAVRRRLAFDAAPAAFVASWRDAEEGLAARVRAARPVPLATGLERAVAELCVAAGAEGLRADLVICRAAAALGGWRGLERAGPDEVMTVAPLALGHRRRTPFGPTPMDGDELERMVANAMGGVPSSPPVDRPGGRPDAGEDAGPDSATSEGPGTGAGSSGPAPPEPRQSEPPSSDPPGVDGLLEPRRTGATGRGRRRAPAVSTEGRGRRVGTEGWSAGQPGALASGATVLAATVRTSGARPLAVATQDLRIGRHEERGERVVVLAVDASGSMGAAGRVAAARAAVVTLVADAYQRRDRVAVIAYRDREARVVLRPTSSTEVAMARLAELETGGRTPLAAGVDAARVLAAEERRRGASPLVVVVTDGRATWAEDCDPVEAALTAGRACRALGLDALVVDCESARRPLGVASALAEAMGARCVALGPLGDGNAGLLADTITASMRDGPSPR